MILRLNHIKFTVCLTSLAKLGRYLLCMLLLLPLCAYAQEQEEDSADDAEAAAKVQDVNEEKSPVRTITFTPEQVRHQKRYNPRAQDSLFTTVWWKRLYGGIGFGVMGMTDNVDHVGALALEAYLGYKFSPISSLRAHVNYTP